MNNKRKQTNKRKRTIAPKQHDAKTLLQFGANGAVVETHKSLHGFTAVDAKTKKPTRLVVPDFSLNNALTRSVRLHEMIHARNPDNITKQKQYSDETRNLAEDCRVHSRYWPTNATREQTRDALTLANIELRAARELLKHGATFTNEQPLPMSPMARAIYAATRSLAIGKYLRNHSTELTERNAAQRLIQRAHNMLNDCSSGEVVRNIHDAIDTLSTLRIDERRDKNAFKIFEDIFDALRDIDDNENETPRGKKLGNETTGNRSRRRVADKRKFEIIELSKTIPTTTQKQRRVAYSSSGVVMSTPRLIRSLVSGQLSTRLYRKARTQPVGGTVLIDASGSMSCDTKTLNRLCAALPFATVAFYEGNGGGHVVVYSRNGTRAETCAPYPVWGGNDIDDLALLWLLEQPEPRTLITDLGYTCPNAGTWIMKTRALENAGALTLHACDVPDAIQLFENENAAR